ncbi:MAG TPA: c-type cytochrome [Rubrivivax sp.]
MHHRIFYSALSAGLLCAGAAAHAQDPHAGRSLAATCANCHGTNGQARGEMKPLAGLPAGRIVAAMADFKSGAQPATIMHQIAKGYTDEQIGLVAAYFAAQPGAK